MVREASPHQTCCTSKPGNEKGSVDKAEAPHKYHKKGQDNFFSALFTNTGCIPSTQSAEEPNYCTVSPHLFRLYIFWENGIAVRPDVAIIWRGVTPNICEDWSEEEDAFLRRCYPDRPQIELMEVLPHRAWYRIYDRAKLLKLRRSLPHQGRARVNVYHRTMRFDDLEAIAQLGESSKEKEHLCQVANMLAKQTMRGSLSSYWWLPLEGIGYAAIGNSTACEADDVELFNLSAFPCVMPHRA
jgi:hypothetical protein